VHDRLTRRTALIHATAALAATLCSARLLRAQSRRPPSALPTPLFRITLTGSPAGPLAMAARSAYQLGFTYTNLGRTVVDPRLASSQLLVNGAPDPNWAFTVSNGPRDARWNALPPRDTLQFGYALGTLFPAPGRYTVVWRVGTVDSAPLIVEVR
jgi:hypothetical protein